MKPVLLTIFALPIAACSKPADQPAAKNAETPEVSQAAQAPVPSLEGEWVVEQINGKAPEQEWPITAEVTKDRFTVVSDCRRMGWTLKQDRNLVRFTPAAGVECARPRSADEYLVDKVLNLANIAMFSDEGREVQLTGPGGNVALTRR